MASLTDNKIKDTYVSLLKVSDNGELDANLQEITDGVGNNTGIQLNTAGDLAASGTVAFGSLKDSGENITVTKFVDEADGISNNDNDSSIPTSAAVKDYVDTNITAQDLDITDGVNVGAVDLDSQVLTFTGAGTVTAVVSNQTVTITGSATDLSNTPSANDVVVESSDGNNTTLAGATTSLAGVMTSADKTKLNGIEAGAEVNPTASEVKTLYESNADTNAFTDAEQSKLSGIESGAEVNTVDSVNTQTGAVVLDADDIDDSATTNKFTTQGEIDKLAGIESGAQVNAVDSVNGATGVVVLDADDIDDTSTTNKFVTSTDVTKLSNITITQAVDLDTLESDVSTNTSKLAGIENGADVTDATNVAAAGAMMTDVAVINDLADVSGTPSDGQVLTYDTVNGWQPESPGAAPVTSVNTQTGAVVLDADDIDDSTTTNKFTTQSDIDKLAGIEAGAEVNTVDSVNGETGVVVLDADDIDDTSTTNKFTTQTDIDKLAGIEALADVTDATNVAAAGALMDGVAELADLADVASTAPSDGQVLTYDTVNGWQPETPSGGGTIDGSGTANYVAKWSDSDTLTDSLIQDDGTTVSVGGVLAVSGDVSIADKIIHTGDTNTAIRFPSADTITLETNGSERMRITSGGNVGIGTTSAQKPLHIHTDATVDAGISLTNSTSGQTATDGFLITLNTDGANATIWNYENGYMRFATNATERMRITSGGDVLIGTTDSSATTGKGAKFKNATEGGFLALVTDSDNALVTPLTYYNVNATYNGYRFYVKTDGGIANFQSSNVNLSDERVKKNIAPLGSYWDKFKALELVTFEYKDQDNNESNIGLIAQQVESVAPELVSNDGFGETPEGEEPLKTIYTSDLYHATIKVLQEAMTKIETLEAEVESLKSKLNA
jgi:hypothetical protein